MSEVWTQEGQPAVSQPDGITAGALLRQARESAGLHVAALAVSLKVPVRKLEALEDNRWDVLPDLVFVRALASSVCRTLKVDPQPILDRLPQTAKPRLVRDDDGINTPFRAPGDSAAPTWADQLTRPVFLVVFAILFGALIMILLPSRQESVPVVSPPLSGAPAEPAPPPVMIPAPEFSPASAATPAAAATTPVASSPVSVPAAAPAVAKPASAVPLLVPAATSAVPAAPASGLVVFHTKGPSWVEVTDARGAITLRKQMESGESVGASGALPLRVTVGRVDNTDVQVRGKAYDLRPVSRDNVARFEVK